MAKRRKNQEPWTVVVKKEKEFPSKDPRLKRERKEVVKQMLGDYRRMAERSGSGIEGKRYVDLWMEGVDDVTPGCSQKRREKLFRSSLLDCCRRERRPVKKGETVEGATTQIFPPIDEEPSEESAHRLIEDYETHQELWCEGMNPVSDQLEFLWPWTGLDDA